MRNIPTPRLLQYARRIFSIETKAFSQGNQVLFRKCYTLLDDVYREIRRRSNNF